MSRRYFSNLKYNHLNDSPTYQNSWGGKFEKKIASFFIKKNKSPYDKFIKEFKEIRNKDCQEFDLFDKKYNIDTSHPIIYDAHNNKYKPGIVINSNIYKNSNGFQNAPLFYIDLMNKILDSLIDKKEFSFIDIGSGKGKIIFYNVIAEQQYKNYFGIEIDKNLFDISQNNLKLINIKTDKKIFFINEDALNYNLPNENCVYFFFRPFDVNIHREFILKNKNIIKNNKTVIVLLCPYDTPNNCVETEIGLTLKSSDKLLNIYTSF